jgi:nicotinamidase-related amidase
VVSWAGEERQRTELKPVLIVVDVQNKWMPRMSEEDRLSAPGNINQAIALFREFGHPVIRVYHSDPRRGPEPGTEPYEFADSIAVTADDPVVVKDQPSAFTKTALEQMLRDGEHNIVFLCGLSATGCVLATYYGARDRGFMTMMIEGALLSSKAPYTKMIEDICASMTIDEVRGTLENPFL